MKKPFVHRFIPNSAPGIKEEMLKVTGYRSADEIFEEIPEKLRFKGDLDLPKQSVSEFEVHQRIKKLLGKNETTDDYLSFLGAGCWMHYIPALCSEIAGRSEFMTAYAGGDMSDLGRYQAMFEFQSMMGDLLEMDVVSAPVYDGTTAAGDAIHIASRATDRKEVLIPATLSPNTLATLKNYSKPWLNLTTVSYHPETGLMNLDDLKANISDKTAAVLIENPGYLGFIEDQCYEIAEIAHSAGALLIASINPISLGLLEAPGVYGADIACGEGQPLGVSQSCGGGSMGLLAVKDSDWMLEMMPSFLAGISNTIVPGELTFSWHTLWDRMVYTTRDNARSYTGTSSWLWGISAAVYMALLGPGGFYQIGKTNMENAHYAAKYLSSLEGVKCPYFKSTHFNEFVVNFNETGKSVQEVNRLLKEKRILGGKDLSQEYPELGQSALYCVTEVHQKDEIDQLAETLSIIL